MDSFLNALTLSEVAINLDEHFLCRSKFIVQVRSYTRLQNMAVPAINLSGA
jgi:hypothetical protein